MYIESFLLTVDPPEIRGGSIVVGEIHEGAFSVEAFPATIEFGALVEFALDDDDPADNYEVEVLLEYSKLDDAPQAPVGSSFEIEAAAPDPDWWGPRVTPQPLAFRFQVWNEFEGFLVLRINGEEMAEKAIRIVHNYLPDALRPGEPT